MIIPATTESEASSSTAVAGPPARGYRLRKGTKLSDIPPVPPSPAIPQLSDLDGPFQLAEYLALKVRHDPHDVAGLVDVPSGDGSVGGKAPEKDVWIYEHLRRIPIDLTSLLASLLPICTRESCPQMKADEWLYLCVAHGGGQTEECCAIDYILHTKNFPSRLSIPSASLTHFPSLFRRLSRIFSHAYFHHREAFSLAEAETSLYARFVALCERYELVGPGLLVIPREVVDKYIRYSKDGGKSSAHAQPADAQTDEDEDEDEFDRGPSTSSRKNSAQALKSRSPTSPSKSRKLSAGGGTVKDDPRASGGMTIGRGTLGRGKQPRTTMLWAAATEAPPIPETSHEVTTNGAGDDSAETEESANFRNRSESIQSAIHIPLEFGDVQTPIADKTEDEAGLVTPIEPGADDESQADLAAEVENAPSPIPDSEPEEVEESGAAPENEADADAGGEAEVPKDEIELLEEEGILEPEPTVAPLPEPHVESGDQHDGDGEQEESDELEEVELGEESEPAPEQSSEQSKTSPVFVETAEKEGNGDIPQDDAEIVKNSPTEVANLDTPSSKDKKKKKKEKGGNLSDTSAAAAASSPTKSASEPKAEKVETLSSDHVGA